MKLEFWIIVLCFVWIACDHESEESEASLESAKPELQESDLGPLYNYFTPNPTNQREEDENAIIEYLAEHDVAAERKGSGIYMVISEQGSGPSIQNGDRVTTHYEGALLNGKVFDSSYRKNKPLTMGVNEGIRGWQEALLQLNVGGKCTAYIPSTLGYGKNGYPPVIPPDANLIFQLEVLGINGEMME